MEQISLLKTAFEALLCPIYRNSRILFRYTAISMEFCHAN